MIIDASVESGEPASLATVSRQAFGPVRSSYHTPTLLCTPRFRVCKRCLNDGPTDAQAGARMVASLFAVLMVTTLTAQVTFPGP